MVVLEAENMLRGEGSTWQVEGGREGRIGGSGYVKRSFIEAACLTAREGPLRSIMRTSMYYYSMSRFS